MNNDSQFNPGISKFKVAWRLADGFIDLPYQALGLRVVQLQKGAGYGCGAAYS
jgi:hypothetical protein